MRIQAFLLSAEHLVRDGLCQLTGVGLDQINCPIFPVTMLMTLFVRVHPEPEDRLGRAPMKLTLYGPGASGGMRLSGSTKCIIDGRLGKSILYEVELPLHAQGLYRLEGESDWSDDEPYFLFEAVKS